MYICGYKCGSFFLLSVSAAFINAALVLQDQYASLWVSRKLEAKHVDARDNGSINELKQKSTQ